MPETEYEVWREQFRIVEWRDDSIYRTESQGSGWFDEAVVKSNKPRETNILFAPASTHDAHAPKVGIRVKRGPNDQGPRPHLRR